MTYNISENQAKKDIGSQPLRNSKSIFISYNHLDETYKDDVIKTLNGLSYLFPELKFDIWSDDRIKTGQRWKEEIEQALELAGIAILIMSRNFLGSEFIMTNELPIILDNANKKGTIIMNLIAGKCLTNGLISQYQCVNDPNEPLKKLTPHEQDVVYVRLADDVKRYLST